MKVLIDNNYAFKGLYCIYKDDYTQQQTEARRQMYKKLTTQMPDSQQTYMEKIEGMGYNYILHPGSNQNTLQTNLVRRLWHHHLTNQLRYTKEIDMGEYSTDSFDPQVLYQKTEDYNKKTKATNWAIAIGITLAALLGIYAHINNKQHSLKTNDLTENVVSKIDTFVKNQANTYKIV